MNSSSANAAQSRQSHQGRRGRKMNRAAQRGAQQRRCAVCRISSEKAELVRFVACEAEPGTEAGSRVLRADLFGLLPGRGVYCHLSVACLTHVRGRALLESSLGSGSKRDKRAEIGVSLVELLRDAVAEQQRRTMSTARTERVKRCSEVVCSCEQGLEKRPAPGGILNRSPDKTNDDLNQRSSGSGSGTSSQSAVRRRKTVRL